MPHMARNLDILDLKVGNRRFKMRVPVDQSFAAIDQTFSTHLNKDLDHRIVEIAALIRGGVWGP